VGEGIVSEPASGPTTEQTADAKLSHDADRRPIASREWTVSRRLASWMVRRGVSPNAISVAGMVAGIAAGVLLTLTPHTAYHRLAFFAAAVLMQLRLLANLFDGMVAIESGKASPVGAMYNEVPDRVSDTAKLIGAGYALGGDAVLGFVAACLALFTAYVRAQGRVAGAPQEFCGPMAKQQRVAVLTVAALYSALAPAAWQPRFAWRPEWGVMAWALALIAVGSAFTSVRRLRRIGRTLRRAAA
jgi:phosphatidylglycerophosphate synthase